MRAFAKMEVRSSSASRQLTEKSFGQLTRTGAAGLAVHIHSSGLAKLQQQRVRMTTDNLIEPDTIVADEPIANVSWGFLWPLASGLIFLAIPLILFAAYPYSFWVSYDYQPLGLADALNLAYRIGDHQLYAAAGMAGHPGVPFYLMNWLALALTGYPVATKGDGFFDAVISHIDLYHTLTIWLAASTGAIAVFLYVWVARFLAPLGVIALGLLIWLASTPATLQAFLFPSIDAFALLINGLFFVTLMGVAYDRNATYARAIICGCVGAFAYLNKLSYIYVPLALAVAEIASCVLRKEGWKRGTLRLAFFAGAFVSVVAVVGFAVIGLPAFRQLLKFHLMVFESSGLYGTGDHTLISGTAVWHALTQIPSAKSYAIFIALIGGVALSLGGLISGFRRPEHLPAALTGIGAGVAATLSAVFVLKHYEPHYVAGVSATLPACVVAGYRLAKSWGLRFNVFTITVAILSSFFMAYLVSDPVISSLLSSKNRTELAHADLQEINRQTAGDDRTVEFSYRTPFSWYGEGFAVIFANVPRLTKEYHQVRQSKISGMTDEMLHRNIGAHVIDKAYFPTVESVKAASNVALLGPKPVTFENGDKLIELRTVFLLIRGR